MVFEESLATWLSRWVPSVAGQIHGLTLPQPPKYPAVVYVMSGGQRIGHMTGQSGLCRSHLDLDCWARSYPEVKALAREVRLALNRHSPQTPLATGGPNVGGFENLSADLDEYDAAGQAFATTIQCDVWHEEDTF